MTRALESARETARDVARRFWRWHLRELIALILTLGSIGWGVSLLIFPEGMSELRAFQTAVAWASPQAWAWAIIITSITIAPAMWLSPRMAAFPAALLGGVWAALAMAMIVNSFTLVVVPTAAWAYAMLAAFSGAVSWASVAEYKD